MSYPTDEASVAALVKTLGETQEFLRMAYAENVRLRAVMLECSDGIHKWGSVANSKSFDFIGDKLREEAGK